MTDSVALAKLEEAARALVDRLFDPSHHIIVRKRKELAPTLINDILNLAHDKILEEREACAKIAYRTKIDDEGFQVYIGAEEIAAAIRQRGEPQ